MDIQIGEYVRSNNGMIGKLIKIERDDIDTSLRWHVINDGKNERYINKAYIVKHSFNIIDLIEIKDIVEIQNISDKLCFKVEIFDEKTLMDLKLGLEENEIKLISILTQEQYKTNCYRLED